MRNRLLAVVWLAALMIYVVAGMPIAPFHGDEPMLIYASHDYTTAFREGNPQHLATSGPYPIDSDNHLRILNGSVNHYAIGLLWHLAGYSIDDLPPRPGWDWGLSYDANVESNHRPSETLLILSRIASTLMLALSVGVMFGIGWQMGGPTIAYIASTVYVLNPALLLNGRRAVMEGSLLFFGLLTIFIALTISKKQTAGKRGLWLWWLGLTISGGLTLASKHSGLIYVGGALGWIFVAALLQRQWREAAITTVKLVVSGITTIAIFIALSPALWNNPPARLQDLLALRAELIDIQVTADPIAPTSLGQRIEAIITQPFMTPPAHFEAGGWTDFSVIAAEIGRYMASPLSGLQPGVVGGALFTLLAAMGMAILVRPRLTWRIGLFIWLALTLAMLLVNPLPWQRYYLPLMPIASLLASLGINALLARFVNRPEQDQSQNPIVSDSVRPQTIK